MSLLRRLLDIYLQNKFMSADESTLRSIEDLIVTYSTVYCAHRKLEPKSMSLEAILTTKGPNLITEADLAQKNFERDFFSVMRGALIVAGSDPATFAMLQEFIDSERGGLC